MECTYNIKFTWISTTHWNMHRAPPKMVSVDHIKLGYKIKCFIHLRFTCWWMLNWIFNSMSNPDNSKNPFKGIEIHTSASG